MSVSTLWAAYKTKIIVVVALAVPAYLGINYVRDLRQELEQAKVQQATLAQKFQQLTPSTAISGNAIEKQKPAAGVAEVALGPGFATWMQQNNGLLLNLTQTQALINARLVALEGKLSQQDFATHRDDKTGALTSFPIEQVRTDATGKPLPPLTTVNISYDPKQPDVNAAFRGTSFLNNQEVFRATFATVKNQKTGGFATVVSAKREVSKPDSLNPGKMILVGTEDIPLQDSQTTFTPEGLQEAKKIPRWTGTLGIGKSVLNSKSYQPWGTIDYRLSDKYGIAAGVANGGLVGGFSIRFGAPK
jgi:hypothetical protein